MQPLTAGQAHMGARFEACWVCCSSDATGLSAAGVGLLGPLGGAAAALLASLSSVSQHLQQKGKGNSLVGWALQTQPGDAVAVLWPSHMMNAAMLAGSPVCHDIIVIKHLL